MERVCFTLDVRPSALDEYRDRHADVWPDMRAALSYAGWTNYTLFLRPDGLAIGYVECEDFALAQDRMAGHEVNARWQARMAPLVDALPGRRVDQSLQQVPSIFHLD